MTRIRLNEGYILAGLVKESWPKSQNRCLKKIWKNNLAGSILVKANELGVSIRANTEKWQVYGTGPTIVKVMGEEIYSAYYSSIRGFNLFYINQLIDITGTRMITWNKLRVLQTKTLKGRKAKWFNIIEKKVIRCMESREVIDRFKLPEVNSLFMQTNAEKLSDDRRRHEWVIINKENAESIVGRIRKKRKTQVLVDHWVPETSTYSKGILRKCKRCKLSQIDEIDICQQWVKKNKVLGVIPKINTTDEGKVPLLLKEIKGYKSESGCLTKRESEREICSVVVNDSHEKSLIIEQGFDQELEALLIQQLEGNVSRNLDSSVYYTDGSLFRSSVDCRMGAGWLQVDKLEETVLEEGKIRVGKWPSSTKAELVAVLMVVLIARCRSEVVVKLDSAAAISSLEDSTMLTDIRVWSKKQNASLVVKIKDVCRSKGIVLQLVKVKAHNKVKWNERADQLAKESARLNICSMLPLEKNCRKEFSVYLDETPVEITTRKLIKTLMNFKTGAEWRNSNAIRSYESEVDSNRSWKALWRQNKKATGIRCKSRAASREIAFRIKCINDSLPVLAMLRRRKPEVYVDDTCVSCRCAKEDSDHLVKCTGYTNYWGIVEEVACLLAWKKLDRAHKRTISVERFGLLIGGVTAEKRFKRRRDYIRGLIPDDVVAELLDLELPKKIVNRALGSYTALVESSFLDEIWRIRCNAVAEWEKKIGIDTAMKRSNP